jgi:hypothetical protein
VNLLAGGGLDDLLAILSHHHRLHGQFGILASHADDIADGRIRPKTKEQVGRRQMEEVQRVRLVHLPVVHQTAHLLCRGRQLFAAHDDVHGLGRSQVVADRTDAAQTLHQNRHFPKEPPLDETLEAAKFHDMQAGLYDLSALVEQNGDFSVSFDAGYRLDDDSLDDAHATLLGTVQSYLMSP